jgi:hypothetical protein
MGETESADEWMIIPIGKKPSAVVEAAPAVVEAIDATPCQFNWTLRKDAAHTCQAWDPSEEDAIANPPTLWCPACRYTAEKAHQERSRAVAAAAAPAPAAPRAPVTIKVTPLQKALIESGGATGRMFLDAAVSKQNMLSWADYCVMDDPHFLEYKEVSEEERKRIAKPKRSAVAAPMRSVRIKSSKSAEEREAETRAWLATPRNKRLAFHKGEVTKDLCVPKDNSVVIANILNDSQTAYGDLRQLLGDHGVVVDMYRPAKPGAPMFVGFLTEGDVAKVIAAFPEGIRYNGRLLPVERAVARSKTGKEMAKQARAH